MSSQDSAEDAKKSEVSSQQADVSDDTAEVTLPAWAHKSVRELLPKLLPFQRQGVQFALDSGARILLADEMGCGKTVQAIAVLCALRDRWPALIVVPASLKMAWADELERWLPGIQPGDVSLVASRSDVRGLLSSGITIATYGMFTETSAVAKALQQMRPQVVVVDESHGIKNEKAARTKLLVPLIRSARHALLLSGTPALARPAELYSQISALKPGEFGTFFSFAKRYCAARRRYFGWDFSGSSNLDELHGRLQSFMVRRLKRDVLSQLPPKRRQRVRLELGRQDAAKVKEVMAQLRSNREVLSAAEGGGDGDLDEMLERRFELRTLLMQAFSLTAEAKLRAAGKYVEAVIQGLGDDGKVLVFAHHKVMLDALESVCAQCKVRYIRIDGDTPVSTRHDLCTKFQEDAAVRVAVLGMTSSGQGITLTRAHTIVFAEMHWTPGVLVQAEDRAHRIGQANAVNITYLAAPGTVDDLMWPLVLRKTGVTSEALNGKRESIRAHLRGRAETLPGKRRRLYAEADAEAEAAEAEEEDGPIKGGLEWFFARAKAGAKGSGAAPAAWTAESSGGESKAAVGGSGEGPVRAATRCSQRRVYQWACDRCTLVNRAQVILAPSGGLKVPRAPECEACGGAVDGTHFRLWHRQALEELRGLEAAGRTLGAGTDDPGPSPDECVGALAATDGTMSPGDAPAYWFSVSGATGRVFVLSDDKSPLFIHFSVEELQQAQQAQQAQQVQFAPATATPPAAELSSASASASGSGVGTGANPGSALLAELGTHEGLAREALAFVRQWTQLTAAERQALSNEPLRCAGVLRAALDARHSAEAGRAMTTERYAARAAGDSADGGGGAGSGAGVDAEGAESSTADAPPTTCGACGGALPTNDKGIAAAEAVDGSGDRFVLPGEGQAPHWWARFCTLRCYRAHLLRQYGSEIRRQLFDLERGVCQLCGLDAHALWQRVRALPPPQRIPALSAAGFALRASKRDSRLLADPKEGMFWQADHEVPVSEGGGQCAIFNFRTLCTPCHERVTSSLRTRLRATKLAASAAGTSDIRSFFGGPKAPKAPTV